MIISHQLTLISPTSGGRSVGIVRSRTKAAEFVLLNLLQRLLLKVQLLFFKLLPHPLPLKLLLKRLIRLLPLLQAVPPSSLALRGLQIAVFLGSVPTISALD
jgi:hypothetical protein